jgi:metallophosphoesterase superfamily enzyme
VAEFVLRPVPGRAALEFLPPGGAPGATIVIADLHLGLGVGERESGVPAESLARSMALELLAIASERGARGVVVVGDVKHPIVGTPPPLRPVVFDFFSTLLGAGLSAEVVLGNHDVGLVRWLPKEVRVHPAEGLLRSGVGFFHGHRWPSNRLLGARRLVVGHLHPGFRFAPTADAPAGKQRCWVRAELPEPPPKSRRRRRHAALTAREVIVLPAFNPVAGTEALNQEHPHRGRSFLVARFLAPGRARAYLLDGTDLGPILTSPSVRRSAAAPGSGKARSPAPGTASRSRPTRAPRAPRSLR